MSCNHHVFDGRGGDKEDLKASGMASGHIVRYLRSSIHDADRALIANPV